MEKKYNRNIHLRLEIQYEKKEILVELTNDLK